MVHWGGGRAGPRTNDAAMARQQKKLQLPLLLEMAKKESHNQVGMVSCNLLPGDAFIEDTEGGERSRCSRSGCVRIIDRSASRRSQPLAVADVCKDKTRV